MRWWTVLMEIEIRPARPSDTDAVADYHHRCFEDTYAAQILAGDIAVPDFEGTRQQLREWFLSGSDFDTHVAVADGVTIGHFTVLDHHLVHLFVAPEYQGTGLGKRMLALGEAAIAAAGHTEFELHTRVENTNAIAFYKNAGWVMTDRLIHTVEHGIDYYEHVMVKPAG